MAIHIPTFTLCKTSIKGILLLPLQYCAKIANLLSVVLTFGTFSSFPAAVLQICTFAILERGIWKIGFDHDILLLHLQSRKCEFLVDSLENDLQNIISDTLEYLITVQHLLNVHNEKLDFISLAKKDNLMLLN